jgi:hypothetical protein
MYCKLIQKTVFKLIIILLLFFIGCKTESDVSISWAWNDCCPEFGSLKITVLYDNAVAFTMHEGFETTGSGDVTIVVTTEEGEEESKTFKVQDDSEYHLIIHGNRDQFYNDGSYYTSVYIDSPSASETDEYSVMSKNIKITKIELELCSLGK